jgi:hypothetical protein
MVYEAKIDELHGSFALDRAIPIGDHTQFNLPVLRRRVGLLGALLEP